MATPRTIEKLFHFAYPCRDAEETRAFYEDVLGLPMTSCVTVQSVPSSGDPGPYLHLFFEMRDGSYLAFFDLGKNEMPMPSPNTPKWVQHFAMEVPSMEDVLAMQARLQAPNIDVIGVVDHDFIQSIYFFDPNGLRLEVTTRTEQAGFLAKQAAEAHSELAKWQAFKKMNRGLKAN